MLVGPSTVGKTDLALALAREVTGEIVNADKFYLFSEFPSTTGLPDFSRQPSVRTHLYGILKPDDPCLSDHEYACRASDVVTEVLAQGKTPIVEGCYYRFARALVRLDPVRRWHLIGIRWPEGTDVESLVRERIDEIFGARGGVEEVRQALAAGYRHTYVMQTGSMVRPLVEYIDGKITLEVAKRKAVAEVVAAAYRAYRRFLDLPNVEWYEHDRSKRGALANQLAEIVRRKS
ncbi:MAG: hypothetical protein ACF8NJ_06565 [Phycisphaerales bacterium JB038]